jgi:hypothetical protein
MLGIGATRGLPVMWLPALGLGAPETPGMVGIGVVGGEVEGVAAAVEVTSGAPGSGVEDDTSGLSVIFAADGGVGAPGSGSDFDTDGPSGICAAGDGAVGAPGTGSNFDTSGPAGSC